MSMIIDIILNFILTFTFLNVFTYVSSSLCFVSVLQGPAVGPHWPLTGIRGWRLTLARGCRSQQFLRKVATAALIGWLPTCWWSVTPDTTGDNIDRKTVSGWAYFISNSCHGYSLDFKIKFLCSWMSLFTYLFTKCVFFLFVFIYLQKYDHKIKCIYYTFFCLQMCYQPKNEAL